MENIKIIGCNNVRLFVNDEEIEIKNKNSNINNKPIGNFSQNLKDNKLGK